MNNLLIDTGTAFLAAFGIFAFLWPPMRLTGYGAWIMACVGLLILCYGIYLIIKGKLHGRS